MEFIGDRVQNPEIFNDHLAENKIGSNSYNTQPQSELYFKDIQSDDEVEYNENNGIFFVRNQILLTANDGVSFADISSLASYYNAKIVGYIELTNDFQIEFKNDVSIDNLYKIIDELMRNSSIEYASLNTAFDLSPESDTIIDDPESNVNLDSKKLTNNNWNIYAINADKAWKNYYDQMTPVKIGMIDTVFSKPHEDLTFIEPWADPDSDINTYDQKSQHHGTRVAGVMAAGYNNGKAISGICPKNELYVYSLLNGKNIFTTIMSYKYGYALLIANNVRVINCSIGYEYGTAYAATINAMNPSNSNKSVRDSIKVNSDILDDFLTKLVEKGYDFTIVASAGNANTKFYIADSSCTSTYGYR